MFHNNRVGKSVFYYIQYCCNDDVVLALKTWRFGAARWVVAVHYLVNNVVYNVNLFDTTDEHKYYDVLLPISSVYYRNQQKQKEDTTNMTE